MATTAFNTLATFQIPSPSRILPSSCCPDKDLIILISRLGSLDRISLWNTTQGTKIWETEIGEDLETTHVVDLAWSPDGQSVAVLYEPPNVSIHSIQDGKKSLSFSVGTQNQKSLHTRKLANMSGIWWFKNERPATRQSIPDIFKRNGLVTGSSLSILKSLPLLDSLPEDMDHITATDIFAFQGSHTRAPHRSVVPGIIKDWPTLISDPLLASISPLSIQTNSDTDSLSDDGNATNKDSLLVVADNNGCLSFYQDGAFPLGIIKLGDGLTTRSLYKTASSPSMLRAHLSPTAEENNFTTASAVQIDLPLLRRQFCRELSQLSSVARDLTWYAIRVVKEMRNIWFGSETTSGVREWGPRWVRSLELMQKEQYGQDEPTALLDLTCLLVTGRASDSLSDFLASGEQMSERGIQKWESTMSESLAKLRDYAEKQLAPALQRLHLILEEVQGWSLLPQYKNFELPFSEISSTLDTATRGVTCASWLAVVTRKEFTRFREFITWLRYEVSTQNNNEAHAIPRHDILEVNAYLMSGLVVSTIDKWFIGPSPQFAPRDLGIPTEDTRPLGLVLDQIQNVAEERDLLDWHANGMRKDLSHLDRNLDALVQDLSLRCHRIFCRAAAAASRSATISSDPLSIVSRSTRLENEAYKSSQWKCRERTSRDQADNLIQYLMCINPEDSAMLLLARLQFRNACIPTDIGVSAIYCQLSQEDAEQRPINILEADFFDDENVVIICRRSNVATSATLATVNYVEVAYQTLSQHVMRFREDLVSKVMDLCQTGQLIPACNQIERRHVLGNSRGSAYSIAVNGRMGRRVVCVLDSAGTSMESFDMEGDLEDMEVVADDQ